MNKIYTTLLLGVALLAVLPQAQTLPSSRIKRSLFSSFFSGSKTLDKESSETENGNTNEIKEGEPIYLVPQKVNPNNPPSFVPVLPLRYYASATGHYFIAVQPITFGSEQLAENNRWLANHIPFVGKSKLKSKLQHTFQSTDNTFQSTDKVPPQFEGLTPTEIIELTILAKQIGIKSLDDLPPLEDVKALLGTTTTSETIQAIREYASTANGLELIRDYVMSYQPVKRMDTNEQENSADRRQDDVSNGNLVYVNYGGNRNGYPVPMAGFGAQSQFAQVEAAQQGTEAPPSPGFFSRLRSFFSFGSSSNSEQKESEAEIIPKPAVFNSGQFAVPQMMMPIQRTPSGAPLLNFNEEQLQNYPMYPAMPQNVNGYVLSPDLSEYVTTVVPPADSLNPQLNEAHIYRDEVEEINIKDGAFNVVQQPVRASLPEEPTGQVHKVDIGNADIPVTTQTTTEQVHTESKATESTTSISVTTESGLDQSTASLEADS